MDESSTPVTVKSAFDRLKAVGYPRSFIEKLLPDWWDNSLFKTSAGALQFALILKQRLGVDASFDPDGDLQIHAEQRNARFKRRSDTKEIELTIATGLGVAIARLALFCASKPYLPISCDPQVLHAEALALSGKSYLEFEGLLQLCWMRGIPVLFLKELPRATKRMTGMALSIEGRPVVVLGFNHSQHARQLFVLAHELGHIAHGHLGRDGVIVDEEIDDVRDTLAETGRGRKDAEEREADAFALSLIRNGHRNPVGAMGKLASAASIAATASVLGRDLKIDPDHLILSYAKEHNDWARANQALSYSPSKISAIDLLSRYFHSEVDLDLLSLENQEYLLAVQGFGE